MLLIHFLKKHFVVKKKNIKTTSMWRKKTHKGEAGRVKYAFILAGYPRRHVVPPHEYFLGEFQNIVMVSPSNWWGQKSRGEEQDRTCPLVWARGAWPFQRMLSETITSVQQQQTHLHWPKPQRFSKEPVFSRTNVCVKNNSIKNNLQHFCLLMCVLLRRPNTVAWGATAVYYHGGEGVATEPHLSNRKQH